MRAIIILAVIALLMGLAGWLTLGHQPGRTSINIETQEIERDTKTAVENTEELIDSGVEALKGKTDTPKDEAVDDPLKDIKDKDAVRSAPVEVDEEPVTTSPTETPVTSPGVTP